MFNMLGYEELWIALMNLIQSSWRDEFVCTLGDRNMLYDDADRNWEIVILWPILGTIDWLIFGEITKIW